MPQECRPCSKSFKAQVIAECVQAGPSIANVALTHNLNANLVHKWLRVHMQKNVVQQTAFSPVKSLSLTAAPRAESSCTDASKKD
ncbi:transposase [Pseudomonas versuta]|uniref:transposase n=1 Tax=Pseudomonas versuta TaxID=1788301 RepID=UPI000935E0DA